MADSQLDLKTVFSFLFSDKDPEWSVYVYLRG